MSVRLWYPQLDVYDAVRRMCALLASWPNPAPAPERLYITDFFFANPPLLHRIHMPRAMRNAFGTLGIERPENAFLSYPSGPLLFQKMGEVQRQALQTLIGKGLINVESLSTGFVEPSEQGRLVIDESMLHLVSESEMPLLTFLTAQFAQLGDGQIRDLRRHTGLRRLSQ